MKLALVFKTVFFVFLPLLLPFTLSASQKAIDYNKANAVFQKKCVNCHGSLFRTSGLSLENYEMLMRGGNRGALIVPGNSSESLLIKFLDGREQPQMPPGGQISAKELRIIKAWIDAGAKAPDKAVTKAASQVTK